MTVKDVCDKVIFNEVKIIRGESGCELATFNMEQSYDEYNGRYADKEVTGITGAGHSVIRIYI